MKCISFFRFCASCIWSLKSRKNRFSIARLNSWIFLFYFTGCRGLRTNWERRRSDFNLADRYVNRWHAFETFRGPTAHLFVENLTVQSNLFRAEVQFVNLTSFANLLLRYNHKVAFDSKDTKWTDFLSISNLEPNEIEAKTKSNTTSQEVEVFHPSICPIVSFLSHNILGCVIEVSLFFATKASLISFSVRVLFCGSCWFPFSSSDYFA